MAYEEMSTTRQHCHHCGVIGEKVLCYDCLKKDRDAWKQGEEEALERLANKEAENKGLRTERDMLREELAKHRKLNPSIGMRADGIFGPRGGGE